MASCRWVRPVLTMGQNSADFFSSSAARFSQAGDQVLVDRKQGSQVDRGGDDVVG